MPSKSRSGDTFHVGVVFRDEGSASRCGPLVIEARGYDPKRPTGFGALKKFASFESTWESAIDLENGYKLVQGPLMVPDWVIPGPTGAVDLPIRVRQGHGDAAFVGLAVPLGLDEAGPNDLEFLADYAALLA